MNVLLISPALGNTRGLGSKSKDPLLSPWEGLPYLQLHVL